MSINLYEVIVLYFLIIKSILTTHTNYYNLTFETLYNDIT
jgi:hypothetical protein